MCGLPIVGRLMRLISYAMGTQGGFAALAEKVAPQLQLLQQQPHQLQQLMLQQQLMQKQLDANVLSSPCFSTRFEKFKFMFNKQHALVPLLNHAQDTLLAKLCSTAAAGAEERQEHQEQQQLNGCSTALATYLARRSQLDPEHTTFCGRGARLTMPENWLSKVLAAEAAAWDGKFDALAAEIIAARFPTVPSALLESAATSILPAAPITPQQHEAAAEKVDISN